MKKIILILSLIILIVVIMVNPFVRVVEKTAGIKKMQNNDNDEGVVSSTDFEKAIKEVADSYYIRGKNIQYNSAKGNVGGFFSPEEATEENLHYMVCSAFVKNVYYELCGLKVPLYTYNYLSGSGETEKGMCSPISGEATLECSPNLGKQLIGQGYGLMLYGHRANNNDLLMEVFGSKSGDYYSTINLSEKMANNEDVLKTCIVPRLKVGDIITVTNHVMLVYDVKVQKDQNGEDKVVDATIIHCSQREKEGHISAKMEADKIGTNITTNSKAGSYLNYTNHKNETENQFEGGILKAKIEDIPELKNITAEEFSLVRLINKNTAGNAVIYYNGTMNNIDNEYKNSPLVLSNNTKKRLDFNGLYLQEKADVFDNSVVGVGDTINYTIQISNKSNNDYENGMNLVVKYDTDLIENVVAQSTENSIPTIDREEGTITWQIGKILKSGGRIRSFSLTLKNDKKILNKELKTTAIIDDTISASVVNLVGNNLQDNEKETLKNAYNNYAGNKHGKEFIDEIYSSIGKTLDLKNFDITNFITDTKPNSVVKNALNLNENSSFYNQVLNNYYGKLQINQNYANNDGIKWFRLKNWRNYNNFNEEQNRRADTIYKEHFKTGDILIYKNQNDVNYNFKNNSIVEEKVTNENGEYAYIYIEGTGFVGKNYGNDGQIGTVDDRNTFSSNYYNSNMPLFKQVGTTTSLSNEVMNYQTLLAKDYYVILRPSLGFDVTAPELSVTYSTQEPTNENVVVTISSNEEIQDIEGWTRSVDGKVLTKEYANNVEETIIAKDIAGNESIVTIKIENITNKVAGDLNDNGQLDFGDVIKIYRHIAQGNNVEVATKHPEWKLSDEKIIQGDLNKNGQVDMGDTIKIQRYIAAKNNPEVAQKHPDWLNIQ